MTAPARVTTLANGLRVATDPMAGVQTTSVGLWTKCGTRHEPAPVNGVAHMLEHMLFKGTPRRSAQAIAEEMEDVGGQMNAYTGRENTAYYARVMQQDTGLALDIIADIVQNSLFDAGELARERHVVLQELGQAVDTPDDIVYDYFHEAAYPGQAVGRAILGTEQSVSALTPQALRDYIRAEYLPGRLVLSAAGAVDHDWLVGEAERLFANLPQGNPAHPEPARYVGGDDRRVEDLEQVHLILGFPACGFHDPDYYASQVFSTALGGGMSSRLFQEIRERRGLAYSVNSFIADFEDDGVLGIYVGTSAESLGELIPALCHEVAASAAAFDEREIARARAQMKTALLIGLESSFGRAETLALNLLTYDRVIPVEETLAEIDAVDAAALSRVAARMRQSPPTVTALGPIETLAPYDEIATRCARMAA
jgi:predicted Zn-dependent peptidase